MKHWTTPTLVELNRADAAASKSVNTKELSASSGPGSKSAGF